MQGNYDFLRFRELLKFVFENKYSDFYRRKYEQVSFNPLSDFKSIEDIKKIPFLTRKELAITDPKKLLFIEEDGVDCIIPTSGTTGDPFFVFHSFAIPNLPTHHDSLNFGKILSLVNPLRIKPNHYFIPYEFKIKNNQLLPGDIYNIPASLKIASKIKVNTIYTTTPSLAIILKDYLDQNPELKNSLKFLILGGELVSPYKKIFLQELYPNLEIFINYGAAEFPGTLGDQCTFLAQRNDRVYYHPLFSIAHLEIIDPLTEKNVEIGKEGELVVTCFHNRATPLIRYKTGDLVRFHKNDCPCGCPGPLLEVLGRAKFDIVKVGGFGLRREMLEKAILNLKDYLKESFEAHFYENFIGTKPRTKMILNLSLKKWVKETPELKRKIERELLENWQLSPRLNLKMAVEAGLFEIPQINFVQFPLQVKARQVLILH